MGHQQSRQGERRRKSDNEINAVQGQAANVRQQAYDYSIKSPNFQFQPTSQTNFHIPHTVSKTVSPNVSQKLSNPKQTSKTNIDQNNSLHDDPKVIYYLFF